MYTQRRLLPIGRHAQHVAFRVELEAGHVRDEVRQRLDRLLLQPVVDVEEVDRAGRRAARQHRLAGARHGRDVHRHVVMHPLQTPSGLHVPLIDVRLLVRRQQGCPRRVETRRARLRRHLEGTGQMLGEGVRGEV